MFGSAGKIGIVDVCLGPGFWHTPATCGVDLAAMPPKGSKKAAPPRPPAALDPGAPHMHSKTQMNMYEVSSPKKDQCI